MSLYNKINKAKQGYYYNDPYSLAHDAAMIPITGFMGYATGMGMGAGMGYDEKTQRRFGAMSMANNMMTGIGNLASNIWREREMKSDIDNKYLSGFQNMPDYRQAYEYYSSTPRYAQHGGQMLQNGMPMMMSNASYTKTNQSRPPFANKFTSFDKAFAANLDKSGDNRMLKRNFGGVVGNDASSIAEGQGKFMKSGDAFRGIGDTNHLAVLNREYYPIKGNRIGSNPRNNYMATLSGANHPREQYNRISGAKYQSGGYIPKAQNGMQYPPNFHMWPSEDQEAWKLSQISNRDKAVNKQPYGRAVRKYNQGEAARHKKYVTQVQKDLNATHKEVEKSTVGPLVITGEWNPGTRELQKKYENIKLIDPTKGDLIFEDGHNIKAETDSLRKFLSSDFYRDNMTIDTSLVDRIVSNTGLSRNQVMDKQKKLRQNKILYSLDKPFLLHKNDTGGERYAGQWDRRNNRVSVLPRYHRWTKFGTPISTVVQEELAHKTLYDNVYDADDRYRRNMATLPSQMKYANPNSDKHSYLSDPQEELAKQYVTKRYLADYGFPIDQPVNHGDARKIFLKNYPSHPQNVRDYYQAYFLRPNKDFNKFQQGGRIPRYQLGGTRADSLALYNNARTKEAFYGGNPEYDVMKSATSNSDIPSLLDNSDYDLLNIVAADYAADSDFSGMIGSQEPRFKRINDNLSQFGDILLGAADSYYNSEAPPILLHRHIKPSSWVMFSSQNTGDASDIPVYDPALVAPYDIAHTLSEAEKKRREAVSTGRSVPYTGMNPGHTVPKPTRPKLNLPNSIPTMPATVTSLTPPPGLVDVPRPFSNVEKVYRRWKQVNGKLVPVEESEYQGKLERADRIEELDRRRTPLQSPTEVIDYNNPWSRESRYYQSGGYLPKAQNGRFINKIKSIALPNGRSLGDQLAVMYDDLHYTPFYDKVEPLLEHRYGKDWAAPRSDSTKHFLNDLARTAALTGVAGPVVGNVVSNAIRLKEKRARNKNAAREQEEFEALRRQDRGFQQGGQVPTRDSYNKLKLWRNKITPEQMEMIIARGDSPENVDLFNAVMAYERGKKEYESGGNVSGSQSKGFTNSVIKELPKAQNGLNYPPNFNQWSTEDQEAYKASYRPKKEYSYKYPENFNLLPVEDQRSFEKSYLDPNSFMGKMSKIDWDKHIYDYSMDLVEVERPKTYYKDLDTYLNKFKPEGSVVSRVYQALSEMSDLSPKAIAGIIGNIQAESSMNPANKNEQGNGNAYGLFQMIDSRQDNLFNKYGENPTIEQQVKNYLDEIKKTRYERIKFNRAIKRSRTPEEYAENIALQSIRPSKGEYKTSKELRKAVSRYVADNFEDIPNMSDSDWYNEMLKIEKSLKQHGGLLKAQGGDYVDEYSMDPVLVMSNKDDNPYKWASTPGNYSLKTGNYAVWDPQVNPMNPELHDPYMNALGYRLPIRKDEAAALEMAASLVPSSLVAKGLSKAPLIGKGLARGYTYIDELPDRMLRPVVGAVGRGINRVGKGVKGAVRGFDVDTKDLGNILDMPTSMGEYPVKRSRKSKRTQRTPWKKQELPGLHLNATMTGGPIEKSVSPKTGLINVSRQALGIIGKESGGPQKVQLIKDVLGDIIPEKMDYNEFRKLVQDQLIPLERLFSTKNSDYGLMNIGLDRTAPELLENQTLILGNKGKFGRGSSAHDNPGETLGHTHFFRHEDTPDILTVSQLQADAFQGTHRIMPKKFNKERELKNLARQEKLAARKIDEWHNAVQQPDGSWKYPGSNTPVSNYLHKQGPPMEQLDAARMKKAEIENFPQKQLLDKDHENRFLQELVSYAADRGDVGKIRLPTTNTANKIQDYGSFTKDALKEKIDKLKFDKTLDKESKDKLRADITILKKYKENEKRVKKLFGKTPTLVTDSRGNTWHEFDIPDSFKKGKGEIKAFSLAPMGVGLGAAGTGVGLLNQYGHNQDNSYKQGGHIPTSNLGLYEYPNQPVRVPSNNITMQGIDYPVMAYPDGDRPVMMQPDQNYYFPNSSEVVEVPVKQRVTLENLLDSMAL